VDDTSWDGELPEALRLLAQPLRWRLLRALARSDRTVRELTDLTQERQSLVSYHLQALQRGGLVTRHRSTADGRDHYYAVDLRRCRTDLQASVRSLHPGLWPSSEHVRPKARARPRVLFLCTGNSARSQIAEALTDQSSDGSVRAASAGSAPKPLHPNAVRVMRKRGVDIAGNRTKHLDEFVAQPFDLVVTLCDRVREVCPEFAAAPERAHWSLADPSEAGATLRASYPAFERTADDIEDRVSFLLDALHERERSEP
jgi:protein-tyrosine-phosphatase/DNA-binding transcriptional ArsR family regulator